MVPPEFFVIFLGRIICSIIFYFPYLVPLLVVMSKARLNVLELEFTFSFIIAIKHPKQIFNLKP